MQAMKQEVEEAGEKLHWGKGLLNVNFRGSRPWIKATMRQVMDRHCDNIHAKIIEKELLFTEHELRVPLGNTYGY